MLSKRMTFQLTPLLDLLLIVIFAQYMEVKETAAREEEATTTAIVSVQQQRDLAESELAKTRLEYFDSLEKFQKQMNAAKSAQETGEAIVEQLEARELELTKRLKETMEQQKQVGEIFGELFRVPEEMIERVIAPSSGATHAQSAEERQQLRERFRQMAQQRGEDVVRHLLTYEELRKRCDLWDIYVAPDGQIVLTAGNQTHKFRADSPQQFATTLFERYKTLPQPKSLVIVLLSFGDAKAIYREAARDGLPLATDRMRADSNGRSRFEFAVLGYRPKEIQPTN